MTKFENAIDLEKKLKDVKDVKDKLLKIYDDMDAIKYVLLNPDVYMEIDTAAKWKYMVYDFMSNIYDSVESCDAAISSLTYLIDNTWKEDL